MKTTINISGKEVEIELTKEQVEAITKATKNEFEIDYEGNCSLVGIFMIGCEHHGIDQSYINHGRYRKTKELAELSLKYNQQFNRLEELAMWLEPDWRADWFNEKQEKYYIIFDYDINKFYIGSCIWSKGVGTVYMSKETATKICNALNNGKLPELVELLKG